MRVFAADPDNSKPMRLEVSWRNGTRSAITNIEANRIYEVDQASALPEVRAQKSEAKPLFKDVSSLIGHLHVEDNFDDWAEQPSLPRRLSRLGPGVSWYDADGDGWEDLIVTSGKGGKLAVYRNQNGQSFHPLEGAPIAEADQGAVLSWSDAEGLRKLLVGISNYEMKSPSQSAIAIYSMTNLASPGRLPAEPVFGPWL